jgi:hypothetical protein
MLTAIPNLPAGVIGFESSGKLEATDYRDTLAPALQKAGRRRRNPHGARDAGVRGHRTEGDLGDASVGIKNWSAWKRVAFVTDVAWMAHATNWFGWMSPGEIKHFPSAEMQAAIDWAAG